MVDDVVRQVVETLKKNGVYENTIIVFASDNGFANPADLKAQLSKGHHPSMMYRGVKTDIFEGGHRVPFIVSWGGKLNKGKVSSQLVSTTDFFRTAAELTNATIADNTAEDSYSFLSEITGKNTKLAKREAVVHHSSNGFFAIRKGNWKLILCAHSGGNSFPKENSEEAKTGPSVQLYDMANDIEESKNLQDKHPQVVQELTDLMTKYIRDGRSTQGKSQTNEGPSHWKQLTWLKE
jgi:arylsulfatase A